MTAESDRQIPGAVHEASKNPDRKRNLIRLAAIFVVGNVAGWLANDNFSEPQEVKLNKATPVTAPAHVYELFEGGQAKECGNDKHCIYSAYQMDCAPYYYRSETGTTEGDPVYTYVTLSRTNTGCNVQITIDLSQDGFSSPADRRPYTNTCARLALTKDMPAQLYGEDCGGDSTSQPIFIR